MHILENGRISFAVFPEREIRFVTENGLFSGDNQRFYKLDYVRDAEDFQEEIKIQTALEQFHNNERYLQYAQ